MLVVGWGFRLLLEGIIPRLWVCGGGRRCKMMHAVSLGGSLSWGGPHDGQRVEATQQLVAQVELKDELGATYRMLAAPPGVVITVN